MNFIKKNMPLLIFIGLSIFAPGLFMLIGDVFTVILVIIILLYIICCVFDKKTKKKKKIKKQKKIN